MQAPCGIYRRRRVEPRRWFDRRLGLDPEARGVVRPELRLSRRTVGRREEDDRRREASDGRKRGRDFEGEMRR